MADLLLLGTTGYTFGWPSHGNNRREPTNDAKISTQKVAKSLSSTTLMKAFLQKEKKIRETLWNGQNFFRRSGMANLFF